MGTKELIKKAMPHVYNLWHSCRVNYNNWADQKKKEAYDKYGSEVLGALFKMVINKKYDVSCYYGTLLGLIRDDVLIPWDDDLDFIILNSEGFSWDKFENDMKEAGFWKFRTMENNGKTTGQSYKMRGVLCDFTLKEPGFGMEKSLYGGYQIPGEKYVNGKSAPYRYWECQSPQTNSLEERVCSGIKIKIPANYEEVLVSYYGTGWRTPDPNFVPDRKEVNEYTRITYFRKPIWAWE